MLCILRRYLINHISYTFQFILHGELFIDWNGFGHRATDHGWVNEFILMRDRKSRPQGSTTRTLLLNGRHYHLISTITLYSTPILNLHPGSSNNLNIMINWFDLFAHFILFGFIHSTFRMLGNLTFYGKWGIQALFNSEWIFESISFV